MTAVLARRIFLAHIELSYRLGRRVTLAEFGELIAREMGRDRPFTAAAVSRWEAGTQLPSTEVVEAIAVLSGIDPGWISHGARSAAPSPNLRAPEREATREEKRDARPAAPKVKVSMKGPQRKRR